MIKKHKKRPPIWIVILMILSVLIGISTAVVGISKIENYFHPFWFFIVFGGAGFLVGILMTVKFKPFIGINPKLKSDYRPAILYISTGFLGAFILLGSLVNQELSKIDKCDKYVVINKYRQESRFRTPEINSLYVTINGKSFRLICSRDYWHRISIGQEIDLCLHKSIVGFDFISLTDDMK